MPIFFLIDARELTGQMILDELGLKRGDIDCVTGGPPCQGFSYAGRRNVADPRNNLVFEFARLIIELQPKTFVFENVPGILNMTDEDGIPILDKFVWLLEEGNYASAKALKKVLTGDPKAKMAIRSRSSSRRENREKKAVKVEQKQLEMF